MSKFVFADNLTGSGRRRGGVTRRTAELLGVFLVVVPDAARVVVFDAVLRVLVFFFDGAFVDFFDATVFFFDGRFCAAVFFLLALERFFETALDVRFFEAAVFFFDVRFLDPAVRRVLTAGRFLRLAVLRAVLRTDAFFDVFFLVAAFFAGIVGLQDRLKTRSAIIQMPVSSGRPKIQFFSTPARSQNDGWRGLPIRSATLGDDARVNAPADVEIGRDAHEAG